MRSFGNFCVASVLGSSCTTCTLRSGAPYAPINSSKYLCLERSLIIILIQAPYSLLSITTTLLYKKTHEKATKKAMLQFSDPEPLFSLSETSKAPTISTTGQKMPQKSYQAKYSGTDQGYGHVN
ncbi:MAG: hypothetical protein LBJ16_01605 [Holosporaceae bacterium]|nr:hypothetical protein [Holosporaceae bacterium]